jgi:hypothetical protein
MDTTCLQKKDSTYDPTASDTVTANINVIRRYIKRNIHPNVGDIQPIWPTHLKGLRS